MGIDGKSSEWSRWFASHSLLVSNLKMALDIWYSSASNALEAEEYQRRCSWEKMNKVKCIYNMELCWTFKSHLLMLYKGKERVGIVWTTMEWFMIGSWLIHDCWLVSICVILLRNGYANKLQITVKTYLFQGEKVPQTPNGNTCQMHNNYCNCTVILTFILWLMIWKPINVCHFS